MTAMQTLLHHIKNPYYDAQALVDQSGQREDTWRGTGWRPSARHKPKVGLAIGVLVLVALAVARGVHCADCEPRVQEHRGTFSANLRHYAMLPVEL